MINVMSGDSDMTSTEMVTIAKSKLGSKEKKKFFKKTELISCPINYLQPSIATLMLFS
jgi:hypothetical protein